jgi:hypothetical protein
MDLLQHRSGCPQLTDPEVTCTCARVPATLPFVTKATAIRCWGEERVSRYLSIGILRPSQSRDGYWLDLEAAR